MPPFFGLAAAATEPVPKTEGGAAARDLPGWLGCWLRLKPAESIPKHIFPHASWSVPIRRYRGVAGYDNGSAELLPQTLVA